VKGIVKEQKGIEYYMQLPYSILLHEIEDEGEKYWIAEVPELPGCKSHGSTIGEAVKNVEEAKKDWILDSLEEGDEIPTPIERDRFSGKTLVRMSRSLHRALSLMAESEKLSLNQLIVTTLAKEVGRLGVLNRVEDKLDKVLGRLDEHIEREEPQILLDPVVLYDLMTRAYEQNEWRVVGTGRSGLSLRDLTASDDIYFSPMAGKRSVEIFHKWQCPQDSFIQWFAQSGFTYQKENEPDEKKLVEA
jgi:antitoxin HicB